jgi:hypothetical protein
MDEIELAVRGKVDDWRVQRIIGYNAYCIQTPMGKRIPMENWLPLPFDDENAKTPEEIQAEYEDAVRNFQNWN